MVRGDTRTFTVTTTNPDGSPYNLASCDMWFSVRTAYGAPGYVFQKTTGGGGITTPTPTNGIALVEVDNGDTTGLPLVETSCVFDVQLKATDGSIFTLNRGEFIVQPEVTTEIA
jgi:hypothetical protein